MTTDFVAEAAAVWGERPALTDGERRWTYAELDAWVSDLAATLRQGGVEPGDLLPVIVDPTPEGVASIYAVARAGATVAPLHPRLTEHERDAALAVLSAADTGPAHVVLWTSGSEGRPRGVALSADNLRASAALVARRLGLAPEDRWLASLSVAHVGGFALLTRCALVGCELLASGAPDLEVASRAIDEGRVTHLSLVPTQLLRLLALRGGAPPPGTLRCVLVGGAHAPADLVARALEGGWPLALTYGKTETTSQVATAPPELVRRVPGTVGAALDAVEVAFGADGELRVRGPTVALGYVGGDAPLVDADGWHGTGDLGRVDEAGCLWITGRRGDRILTGGVTVDAREVERELRNHPAVLDACVVGVGDPVWGERVAALVVGVEGEIDIEELATFVDGRLSSAKRPRLWRCTDRLPLTATGKVDRTAVRASFEG